MREILALLPKPSRYLGIEEGAAEVDLSKTRLHTVLAFPDMYEVGMSYLGHKILYSLLNNHPEITAERVFTPCREAARILREHGIPLATIESDTPLAKTHLIGFSITTELCFTNLLYMLDLADIPLRAEDRGDDLFAYPIIMAGGGCTICAEPVAPFMDIMALGEGEIMMPPLMELLIEARRKKWTKTRFLEEASRISGIYVPRFFDLNTDGSLTPKLSGYTKIKRRAVADLKDARYPDKQVVPFGAVHNRLSLEIARGCTRGCRFCQAGMTLRPSRERNVEEIKGILDSCLAKTGFDDVSFLALSCGDFSMLKHLFLDSAEKCKKEQVSISLPSLRVGSVDGDIMQAMAGIRRTGATLAPEAGSQRLRDVINKGVTEEALIHHVRQLVGYGWQQVKLYFMIGLPTETYEDLDAIVELCKKVRDCCRIPDEKGYIEGPRIAVTAAISPFVPKTHTPFQWEAQISLEEMKNRIFHLRDQFKKQKALVMRWHEPAMSHLEGIISRGDRRLAPFIECAYKKGAIFSTWVEGFSLEPWYEAAKECNINIEEWTGKRDISAALAWDHLETGVSKEFLLKERERALQEKITEDCRYHACRNCGACDTKAGPSL
ncbi:MAG TPA: TIGR03960 family B12-binding radical SAM protein, partial [Desulfovibrio sp.]|nr:TIGR03960 family B12-binding radical SAM protein [Desulfovibrio sp.]